MSFHLFLFSPIFTLPFTAQNLLVPQILSIADSLGIHWTDFMDFSPCTNQFLFLVSLLLILCLGRLRWWLLMVSNVCYVLLYHTVSYLLCVQCPMSTWTCITLSNMTGIDPQTAVLYKFKVNRWYPAYLSLVLTNHSLDTVIHFNSSFHSNIHSFAAKKTSSTSSSSSSSSSASTLVSTQPVIFQAGCPKTVLTI